MATTTASVFEPLSNGIPDLNTCDNNNQRIVGGIDATANTWPWIVRLLFQTDAMVTANSNSYYACGGTIIDENWVLTAAHCCTTDDSNGSVVNMKKVIMKFGEHQTTVAENGEFEAIIDDLTNYMHVHEDYTSTADGSSSNYDVCLINIPNGQNGMGDGLFTVAAQAGYSSSVARVCMPSAAAVHGDACWVAGWGNTSSGGTGSDILQSVGVNIMSNEYCLANSVSEMSILQADEVCAGAADHNGNNLLDGGVDSCQGDSGGPLICDVDGAAVLTGIVSWGFDCAAEGQPGVYGRVHSYISWIESKTSLTLPTSSDASSGTGGTGDSGTGDSGTGDSGTGDSGTGDSGTGDSGTGDSGTGDSGTGDSGTGDSGTGDSGTGDSGTGDSGTGDSGTGDSGTGDSGTGDSDTGDSGTGDSGTGDSSDDTTPPEFETLTNKITTGLQTCAAHSSVTQRSNGSNRIVGGEDAITNSWPWIVRLLLHYGTIGTANETIGSCGGTIIDENWILTAAHCCTSDGSTNPRGKSKSLVQFETIPQHIF